MYGTLFTKDPETDIYTAIHVGFNDPNMDVLRFGFYLVKNFGSTVAVNKLLEAGDCVFDSDALIPFGDDGDMVRIYPDLDTLKENEVGMFMFEFDQTENEWNMIGLDSFATIVSDAMSNLTDLVKTKPVRINKV